MICVLIDVPRVFSCGLEHEIRHNTLYPSKNMSKDGHNAKVGEGVMPRKEKVFEKRDRWKEM